MIDGLQFERLASASGPTGGQDPAPVRRQGARRPSSSCSASARATRRRASSYCSKICCMYIAKHTMLYQHKVHDGRAIVFYMDIRAAGKGYDEFTRRAIEEDGAVYIRGRVSPHLPRRRRRQGAGLRHAVRRAGRDRRRHGRARHGDAAAGRHRGAGPEAVSRRYDQHGFFNEAHPKLRPVETNTAGVFVAGACQAPRDIPDSVAMASATAAKVLGALQHRRARARADRRRASTRRPAPAASTASGSARTAPSSTQEIRDRKGRLGQGRRRRQPGRLPGLRHLPGDLPEQERRAGGLHRRADLRRDQRLLGAEMRAAAETRRRARLRAAHHRLRLQLVHLHRRRPRRHQPPADGAQRAHHPAALHRPHRPALHHQGVRARRRRRHRQRLPPGRLPLHGRQLPRAAALRRLPRAHELHRHRRSAASPSRGSRPPRATSGATSSTRRSPRHASWGRSRRTARSTTATCRRTTSTGRKSWPAQLPSRTVTADAGAPRPGPAAADRWHGRRGHRLGGRPPRRPPRLRHQSRRRRQAHLRHALRAQPGDVSEPPAQACRRPRQARAGGEGLRRKGGRRPGARSAAHPRRRRPHRRALRRRLRGLDGPRTCGTHARDGGATLPGLRRPRASPVRPPRGRAAARTAGAAPHWTSASRRSTRSPPSSAGSSGRRSSTSASAATPAARSARCASASAASPTRAVRSGSRLPRTRAATSRGT